MTDPQVVTRQEWLAARRALLQEEKAFTRARDALSAKRRALPRVRVEEPYAFETEQGPKTLGELFEGRGQLLVQHFMYGPDWDEGCPSCSFWLDGLDRMAVHLAHRDVTYVVVARAALEKLLGYRDRMGWTVPFVSSLGSSFNEDFRVTFSEAQIAAGNAPYNYGEEGFPSTEAPGMSVFQKDGAGNVLHTYSTFARGLDPMNSAYQILDLMPKGRDEDGLPHAMAWLRRRDQY